MPSVTSQLGGEGRALLDSDHTVLADLLHGLGDEVADVASWAEMVATCAIVLALLDLGSLAEQRFVMAAEAASMPRFRPAGLAPAATLRRPSRTIAWASTVAVVVPSPATSLVFVATSLTSCAPRFSYGLVSSISLAIVTPSLVMVGRAELLVQHDVAPARAEGDLDRVREGVDTVLEQVPGVVREAQDLRHVLLVSLQTRPPRTGANRAGAAAMFQVVSRSLLDDSEDIASGEDQVLLAGVLDLGAAVLASR